MRFWEKSLRIFKCLCDHGRQGVRHIAQQTGLSKSSVHRLTQAMERRSAYPESWLWETAEGREWLTRLVVATLYTFGLKRGVGMETLSEFFARVHLETQVGCSPSALRGVMQALERALLTTAGAWEQDGLADGETREIIGAVDETFLEHMMLVFMDLKTGYLLLEVVAEERTYARWKACVDERLTALSTGVRYLVSDRAKALIQLAEVGLEGMSMPDFFHVMHDLVKSYSFAIARRVHQAQQALKKAEEVCSKQLGPPGQPQAPSAAQHQIEGCRRDVERWQGVHSAYRHHLAALSLALHPFDIDNSSPQNSVQVHRRLEADVAALDTLAHAHQLPARDATMHKVRKQLPALAALVDFWWAGVEQDVEQAALSAPWRQWAREVLLPWVYWEHHVAHTRCPQRKAKMRRVREAAQAAFHTHALTRHLPQQALTDWHTWARQQVHAFQRASSAVEGRNGALAQLHHNQRGLPPQRYKVWTVLDNFDCYAPDGTTPAARFFGRAFPDLFETVLSHIAALPQPRRRKCQIALNH